MDCKNFAKELGVGFSLDILFALLMLFLQALNNSNLNSTMIEKDLAAGDFQFMCIILKLLALADISLELLMFIYEVYRLRNLSKQSVDVVVRYSEEKRRAVYHARYFKIAITSFTIAFVSCLILSLLLPEK